MIAATDRDMHDSMAVGGPVRLCKSKRRSEYKNSFVDPQRVPVPGVFPPSTASQGRGTEAWGHAKGIPHNTSHGLPKKKLIRG